MVCSRSDTPDGGLGMCDRCYSREFQVRTRILRKLIEASDAVTKSKDRNAQVRASGQQQLNSRLTILTRIPINEDDNLF